MVALPCSARISVDAVCVSSPLCGDMNGGGWPVLREDAPLHPSGLPIVQASSCMSPAVQARRPFATGRWVILRFNTDNHLFPLFL